MRKWIFPAGYLLIAAAVATGIYLAFRPPSTPAEIEPYGPAAPLKEKYYAAIEADDYETAQKTFDAHQTLLLLAASAREPSWPFVRFFDLSRRYHRNLELKHEAADLALHYAGTQLWLGNFKAARKLIESYLNLGRGRPQNDPTDRENLMLATTYAGDMDSYEGRIQRAGEWYSSAYSLCDEDSTNDCAYSLIDTGLATSIAFYFAERADAPRALEWADFLLQMAEATSDNPDDQLYAHRNKAAAASTLLNCRQTTRGLELLTEAIAGYRKAVPELADNASSSPVNSISQHTRVEFAFPLMTHAFASRPATSTSLAYATEAVRLLDDVTTATPGMGVLNQRIIALRTEAEVLAQLGQTTAGLFALRRTHPYIAEAITRAPTDLRFYVDQIFDALLEVAIHTHHNDSKQRAQQLAQANSIYKKLTETAPSEFFETSTVKDMTAALHYANGREKEARAIIEDLIAKGLFYHSWEEFVSWYKIAQPGAATLP